MQLRWPSGPRPGRLQLATVDDVGDQREWEWFDAQLAHPDGRATGGEPCVVCEEPVPPNAHWKQRDRHVCSSRCNEKLRRRARRRIRSGDLQPPAPEPPPRDPGGIVFRTMPRRRNGFAFEFLGWAPLIGDIVERHGSLTLYLADPVPSGETGQPHSALCLHANTRAAARVGLAPDGRIDGRVWYRCTDASGNWVQPREVFEALGTWWCWTSETIRDVADDGTPYTWTAPICANFEPNGAMWTPAYTARSKALRRTTASTSRHARRQRMIGTDGAVERIDPHSIYERDSWICQLCHRSVDAMLRHPDPASASLDHRLPLAAGGLHVSENVQCAHLRCNLVKGAAVAQGWVTTPGRG